MKFRSIALVTAFTFFSVSGDAGAADFRNCKSVSTKMVALIKEGMTLDCGMNDAWSTSVDYWTGKCINNNENWASNAENLRNLIGVCRKNAAAKKSAGPQAVANSATDVYDKNDGNGNVKCTMNAGDSGNFVGKKEGEANWVGVTKITGECNGKSGWVWDGGTLNIK
jgi:hypothetical protein